MEIQHSLNGQADLGTQLFVPRNANLRAFGIVGSGNTDAVFRCVYSTSRCWECGCGTEKVIERLQLLYGENNFIELGEI